jgi:hypothetical protein
MAAAPRMISTAKLILRPAAPGGDSLAAATQPMPIGSERCTRFRVHRLRDQGFEAGTYRLKALCTADPSNFRRFCLI